MSNKLIITTNNTWRDFVYRDDVPEDVLESQFDWMKEDDEWPDDEYIDGFFLYKDYWYHLDDFQVAPEDLKKRGWDGVSPDSYFSGVLIKLSPDGEQYKIGRYRS